MLVVISDLHFVDATAGHHNLPSEAFEEIFFYDIVELAKKRRATEIKLLLLGDIPDLLRSTHWLDAPLEDRPWGENGLADVNNWLDLRRGGECTPTEALCLRILGQMPESGRREDVPPDTILHQNWETFEFFRKFKTRIQRHKDLAGVPVEIHYVPGNHDRLVNLYPSVRDAVRQIFGLTINRHTVRFSRSGEWWYPYDYNDEAYGLFARHGHQFDRWNYAGGNDITRRLAHVQVPIGDVIATEFAVRLPWQAARHNGVIGQDVITRLQDMDNVRPTDRLLEWFYWELESEIDQIEVRRALDEVADAVLKNLFEMPFVQQWHTPLSNWDELVRRLDWFPPEWVDRLEEATLPSWDEVLRFTTRPWMRWSLGKLVDLTDTSTLLGVFMPLLRTHGDPEDDIYMHAAYREHVWRTNDNISFILYGHTHSPYIFPLEAEDGRQIAYLNTGTWRERIRRTVGLDRIADFIKLKQMTYVVLYGPDEDGGWDGGSKEPGTLSFDMWTGNRMKQYRQPDV